MAIAKVVLNNETLIDVTQKTVDSANMLSGTTALKNDGTSVIGSIVTKTSSDLTASTLTVTAPAGYYASNATKTLTDANLVAGNIKNGVEVFGITGTYEAVATPKLQDKEITIEGEDLCVAGDDTFVYFKTTIAVGSRVAITSSYAALKLKTLDTNKLYNIIGKIIIIDNQGVLETININDTLDPTKDGDTDQYINVPANEYIDNLYFEWNAGNQAYAQLSYHTLNGTYGIQFNLKVMESTEQYDGINSIIINPGYYNIYQILAMRQSQLSYASQIVQNFCNSLSIIYSNQFRGMPIMGSTSSIVFSQATQIQMYGFGGLHDTRYNGFNNVNNYNLYFPNVSQISSWAFARQERLNTINMPILTEIAANAFFICNNLSVVDIPQCSIIGNYAFNSCTKLTSISFSNCLSIGDSAFGGCSSLVSANFSKCTTIGYNAFYNCSNLSDISFPQCSLISMSAFGYNTGLVSINFPECITINACAFSNCIRLVSANFPKCTDIGSSAFASCNALIEASFPNCQFIGSSAFLSCQSLTTISFPECTIIYGAAFTWCRDLSNIYLPKVSLIYSSAFSYCWNMLSTISLPACENIFPNAFTGCYHLLSLYLMGSSYVTLSQINAFTTTPISTYTTSTDGVRGSIYVPASMLDTYKTMTNWVTYSARFVGVE